MTAELKYQRCTRAVVLCCLWALFLFSTSITLGVAQTVTGSALYEINATITLRNDGPSLVTKLTFRLALPQTITPFQVVVSEQISPSGWTILSDEHGNRYAAWEFVDVPVGRSITFDLRCQVRSNNVSFSLSGCASSGTLPDDVKRYLDPEKWIESDNAQIRALATQLATGKRTPCETLRAIYDWVGNNITYSGYTPNDRGAAWALSERSGDCSEFADLVVALARAAGIPARTVGGMQWYSGITGRGEILHSWVEAYLPGVGWVPLDPTLGRSSTNRNAYFASATGDHIIFYRGRNLTVLNGFHYFAWNWWWGLFSPATKVSCTYENWTIRRIGL